MSEMIERAARAFYESPGSDLVAKTDGFPPPPWEHAHAAIKDDCRVRARAAIEAMRAPTEAMSCAGANSIADDAYPSQAETVWCAMIEAALGETVA